VRIAAALVWTQVALGAGCRPGSLTADSSAAAGDAPFVVRASFPVHDEPGPIAASDLDADGHADLVVGGGAVDVLLGDGRGGLARAGGSPLRGPKDTADFAFGDFDEDGRVDLVVAEHDRPRFFLFLGSGERTFRHAPRSPFGVDAKPHVHTIGAADFDGDGHLDVVTDSWPESRLILVPGNGDGTFELPGRKLAVARVPIHNLRLADMNGDGRADLVTPAHEHRAVTVLLSDGSGGFGPAYGSPFPSFGGFSYVAVADLDRDGDADVAELHRSDRFTPFKVDALSILLNDGSGRLRHGAGSPFQPLPERSGALALGEFDGDGWVDVATASEAERAIALFRGGRDGFDRDRDTPVRGRPVGLA
jgi:hypothetical protein